MTITTTDTRPDHCTVCRGTRLPPPYDWATDGDFMTREHTEPWEGGLTPCGDLHQFAQMARDVCAYCGADNGPLFPGELVGPGRMGFDCAQCGGN